MKWSACQSSTAVINARLRKTPRFLLIGAAYINAACDVVIMPHHVGSILLHRTPPRATLKTIGKIAPREGAVHLKARPCVFSVNLEEARRRDVVPDRLFYLCREAHDHPTCACSMQAGHRARPLRG